jgi:hypothetical protein
MMWRCLALVLLFTGCEDAAGTAAPEEPGAEPDDAPDEPGAEPDDAPDTEAALAQCSDGPALFGRPEAATGLSEGQCGPSCACGDGLFAPPETTRELLADLRARRLVTPFPELPNDPYAAPLEASGEGPESVCAVVPIGRGDYRLETWPDVAAAQAAGAVPTHLGACGRCSTLTDLATYMAHNDLTEPVRACGLAHFSGPMEDHVACLEALGFTRPCAQIWYWNTRNTREVCLEPCLAALGQPYHLPDGRLNPCLQCDEDQSGPVFKAVAGRTRRNTGLPNALCRPCSEVRPLPHTYPEPAERPGP